jgi:NAD(P)H-flavin reductase
MGSDKGIAVAETDRIEAEVIEIFRETPHLVSLKWTSLFEGGRFNFRTGQSVNVLCPSGREVCLAIANEPEEKRFVEFLIKDQPGTAAHELCQLTTGDEIKVSRPFGKGWLIERLKGKGILLIGIGSGLSPLRSLLKSILRDERRFRQVTLLYGARTPEDIPFRTEFDLLGKKINLEITISQPADSKWTGFVGRVTQVIPNLDLRPERTAACICGTKAMQEEVTRLLLDKGLSKESIFLNY